MKTGTVISTTVVSVVVLILLIGLVALMFMHAGMIDPQVADFAKILGGALVSKMSTIVDYYMGSSMGSQKKDELISDFHNDRHDH